MKKILFDLFPIILFFAVFEWAGSFPEQANAITSALHYTADAKQLPILLATAAAMAATVLQIAWVALRHGKVDTMLWISLTIITVLGGATLLLHDATFIKWKPTALYWVFATVLVGSQALFKKNLIRSMMQQAQLVLPEDVWVKLNYSWAAFFTGMGALNLYIAYHFSLDAWVKFKVFGSLGLMFAFVLAQGMVLAKYAEEKGQE